MTKDEFQVIETILSLYPELCRAAEQRRDYLISIVLAPNHGDIPVQGGTGISAIERFAEGDRESNNLKVIIDRVRSCVSKLRQEEKQFVIKYYIEKKDIYDFAESGATIYCKRRKICGKLTGVLGVYNLVREWRDIEAERRLEAVKKYST